MYTIEQINSARAAKSERRNRGEDCGDHRGTLKPRLPRPLDDELEQGIAELVASLAFEIQWNAEKLEFLLGDQGECDAIPF